MGIGIIDLTIRVRLDQDITPELAREFVQELDYEIKDTTGRVSISNTEIMDDNIPLDDDSGVACPGCGEEYTPKDIDGGRCLSCGTMIVAKI